VPTLGSVLVRKWVDPIQDLKLTSAASRIERQPEGASLKVAPRGKNVAENATFSLRLVN